MAPTDALKRERDPASIKALRTILANLYVDDGENTDNPPLSIVFDRWREERTRRPRHGTSGPRLGTDSRRLWGLTCRL